MLLFNNCLRISFGSLYYYYIIIYAQNIIVPFWHTSSKQTKKKFGADRQLLMVNDQEIGESGIFFCRHFYLWVSELYFCLQKKKKQLNTCMHAHVRTHAHAHTHTHTLLWVRPIGLSLVACLISTVWIIQSDQLSSKWQWYKMRQCIFVLHMWASLA